MNSDYFEHLWQAFCLIFVIALSILLVMAITADKPVRFYYLTGDLRNGLVIKGDVNWDTDQELALDRATTYPEAIQMVKELNTTLHVK